jgi:hypothetical protein
VTKILTSTEARTRCAAMIDHISGGYRSDGRLVVEILDGVSSVVLAVAGVTDADAARDILAALWADQP